MDTPFVWGTYCSYCGSKFAEQITWPRKCFTCQNDSYKNPIPIVAVILPSFDTGKIGTLIQKRNIEPGKGAWALTSGYVNDHETWQQAAAREVWEEIGISTNSDKYRLLDVRNSASGNMIIFGQYTDTIDPSIYFVPNEEVSEIKFIYSECELAFPTHTNMLRKFFQAPLDTRCA